MRNLRLGCALAALVAIPTATLAQSTGSREFDEEIVVTASKSAEGVAGIVVPNTSKTRQVLTSKTIQDQTPGQSILNTINLVPGVSFQNNDPYGSAGGTLNIRGFDSSRISLTFDGIPLNDTGNYAIFSNQQLDPELIDQVAVSLGSTDIDSPSASASGSTVNYTTRNPTKDFHVRAQGSVGELNFFRIFGIVDTGEIGPFGTRAWFSASHAENDTPFNNYGHIDKQQYNFKLYQPIGSNGDFVSVSGNYNQNRNNFFGSLPLREDTTIRNAAGVVTGTRVVGTASTNRFPSRAEEREYTVLHCQVAAARPGLADVPNTCGTSFDERFNPSNTGSVRVNSRFTLSDKLTLTVDPSYQYVKANGGGTANASEGTVNLRRTGVLTPAVNGVGYVGGTPFAGVDLNGDGDTLDRVTLLTPSQTHTDRFGVIANLRYDFSDTQSVRINYTLDYGKHTQTGEVARLNPDGTPTDVFPINIPIFDSTGTKLEKRDRFSKAILNQVSGQYRGKFFDERLTIDAGIRAPFFKRDLTNYCFTTAANGNVDCFGKNATTNATYAALNPTYQGPQQRIRKYDKILPSGGLTFAITPAVTLYGSYSKGLQVPGTDNLYNSFFFPTGNASANPKPETTDNFDGGVRFKTPQLQVSLAGWYTNFKNRLASTFDPIENVSVFRNLGTVHKYGVDGSVAYTPVDSVTLYVFGSYLKSKILNNLQANAAGTNCATANPNLLIDQTNCLFTAGKRESGAPVYTVGARAEGRLGPLQVGVQAKRTGERYINDQNTPVYQNGFAASPLAYQVYGATAPAYTLVDLDARISLKALVHNDTTYLQLNVSNVFDKYYVGGLGGGTTSNTSVNFVQIGSPRAISGTIVVGF